MARPEVMQFHVHEFLDSVRVAELGSEDAHNHRFVGISSEAIPVGQSHIHFIKTKPDFFDHFHEIAITTGPAIPVGGGIHVHFVSRTTSCIDEHVHRFIFATLI